MGNFKNQTKLPKKLDDKNIKTIVFILFTLLFIKILNILKKTMFKNKKIKTGIDFSKTIVFDGRGVLSSTTYSIGKG